MSNDLPKMLRHKRLNGVSTLVVCAMLAPALTTVIGLLFIGGPSAVRWCVVPVRIDSVKRMLITRSVTHVGVKVIEYPPSLTHANAALTVIRPGCISASVEHASPYRVDRTPTQPMRDICSISFNELLPKDAAATNSIAEPKVCARDDGLVAAVTRAQVISLSVPLFGEPNDAQSTKPSAGRHRRERAFYWHA